MIGNQYYQNLLISQLTLMILVYPNLIFDAKDFTSLKETSLVSLLKREAKTWEYAIKWGIAQNPTLPTNLEELIKEIFRYFHISNAVLILGIK
ncbi:hypothetical protein Glove_216g179 [Diversispora epigaea]|uniref:BACK domain-containing protein n=1 Tax=Diversispora epigaea TaxID=1348612 RepID=A0A397IRD9_9GLOM|nr:hypothetical protein Glove_216g179 [Diversispora epigaea]